MGLIISGNQVVPDPILPVDGIQNITGGLTVSAGGIFGTTTATGGKVEILDTTEQLRLDFDATHYCSFAVNSSGNIVITPSGGSLNLTSGNAFGINSDCYWKRIGAGSWGAANATGTSGTGSINVTNGVFNGAISFGNSLNVTDAQLGSGANGGAALDLGHRTYTLTDNSGSIGGRYVNFVGIPTLAASSATTFARATTFYIEGPPAAGTNATLTSTRALLVAAGAVQLSGDFKLDTTVTAPGTTGNQTINKLTGRVNIAAGGSTITVTNSFVTASSMVFCAIATNDTTAILKNTVPGSGSFVITTTANVTAETAISFLVIN